MPPPTFPFVEIRDIASISTATDNVAKTDIPKLKSLLYFEIAKPEIAPDARSVANEQPLMLRLGFLVLISISDAINDKSRSVKKEKNIPKINTESGVLCAFEFLRFFIKILRISLLKPIRRIFILLLICHSFCRIRP